MSSSPLGLNGQAPVATLPVRRPAVIPRVRAVLLFLITLFSTTLVGARLSENFDGNRAAYDLERDLPAYAEILAEPVRLIGGLPFSLTLLFILLAHEMGHYIACHVHGVRCSPPYFLPFPSLTGTLGAFIRITSPIYSRRALFDIGVAGPIAGFVLLVPLLALGVAFSKIIPGIGQRGDFLLSTPPLVRLFEVFLFPGIPAADIYLHPIARGAWIGVFATALNLLPIGQLDGGHIVYALSGRWHKWVSRVLVAVLVPMGLLLWHGWAVWAVLLFFFGMRHPSICDETRLSSGRRRVALAAAIIFLISFTASPFRAVGAY